MAFHGSQQIPLWSAARNSEYEWQCHEVWQIAPLLPQYGFSTSLGYLFCAWRIHSISVVSLAPGISIWKRNSAGDLVEHFRTPSIITNQLCRHYNSIMAELKTSLAKKWHNHRRRCRVPNLPFIISSRLSLAFCTSTDGLTLNLPAWADSGTCRSRFFVVSGTNVSTPDARNYPF